jgi:hypothetical protein
VSLWLLDANAVLNNMLFRFFALLALLPVMVFSQSVTLCASGQGGYSCDGTSVKGAGCEFRSAPSITPFIRVGIAGVFTETTFANVDYSRIRNSSVSFTYSISGLCWAGFQNCQLAVMPSSGAQSFTLTESSGFDCPHNNMGYTSSWDVSGSGTCCVTFDYVDLDCQGADSSNSLLCPSSSSSDSSSSSSSEDESSSSSEVPSSSSENPSFSSSSEYEIVNCYPSEMEAFDNMNVEALRCAEAGGLANLSVDANNCLIGWCDMPEKSSTSENSHSSSAEESLGSSSSARASSSSFGDNSEGNFCLASNSLFRKASSLYDGWTYLGKESYGSRPSGRVSFKPGTRFFDVLGRAYDKMKARIKYYVFKDAVEREVVETKFEFDVWKKVIKDDEGNDVQMFKKEDKVRGLRRDSSFYWDGSWEVMEVDSLARSIKSRTSLGIKTENHYDNQWRITRKAMVDVNNDTLNSEQYFWKNSKLMKTIFNGVERNFVYGKTLQDTVKVIPSDEGIYFHSGYNNTIGRIASENDPMYRYFAMDPYVVYKILSESNSFLQKRISALSKDNKLDEIIIIEDYIPKIYDPPFTNNLNKNIIYPNGHSNGGVSFALHLDSKCIDDGCGKFYIDYESKTIDEIIILFGSFLVYQSSEWQRYCRTKERMNATYYHEIQHINNAKNRAKWYARSYISTQHFSTKKECDTERIRNELSIIAAWSIWLYKEMEHNNHDSPKPTGFELEGKCEL